VAPSIRFENEGESAVSFRRQVATLFPGNIYSVKNHKIAKISTPTKAREKISTDLESLEFYNFFDVCLTKFKKKQSNFT
jgi:hypothetical protein